MKPVIFALLLTACGTAPSKDAQSPATTIAADKPIATQPGIDPVSEEVVMALAVNAPADLPACGEKNQKQLVYVKSLEAFMTCDGADWAQIEIVKTVAGEKGTDGKDGAAGKDGVNGSNGAEGAKGEKGDKGETGETGAHGAQGIQGVAGAKGDKGDKGEKGDPITGVEWRDPVTLKWWNMGGAAKLVDVKAYGSCAAGFHVATADELRISNLHGLAQASAAINGPVGVWPGESLTDVNCTTACTYFSFSTGATAFSAVNAVNGYFCRED